MDQPISAAESAAAAERLEQTLFEVKKVIVGQEHMVEQMHKGRFFPGRGLAEGQLNNFWETAEPVAFYE